MAENNSPEEIKNILKFDGDLKSLQSYLSNYKVACLIFSAVWCPSCRRHSQHILQIAPKYPNAIFVHIDAQNNPDLSAHFQVVKIPHVKFVKVEGKQIEELGEVVGASSTRLKEHLNQLLPEEKVDQQEETDE